LYVLAGAAGATMVALAILHTAGVLGPFVEMWRTYLPVYAALDRLPLNDLINRAANHTVHLSGFALAAIVTLHGTQAIRCRMMIWITIFGLASFLAQVKGYSYHAYPLWPG
jgi:branched-subunit amino acid transport protein